MRIDINGYAVEFSDCMEVCQGGPQACLMSIDDWALEKQKFDPSPLPFEGKLLVPMRKIGFFKSGYTLVQIDPKTRIIKSLSKTHDYMRLCLVDGRSIQFATTPWGSETAWLTLP